MEADPEDHTFSFMLRSTIGLLLAPPGPLPPRGPRMRGVVRPSTKRARIVLSDDPQLATGVALEFELSAHGTPLNVDAAIDFARVNAEQIFGDHGDAGPHFKDSHGNRIVQASGYGFVSADASFYDHSLFGLLSLMVHGGGVPWFENVYTLGGFMLRDDSCRIYIRDTARRTIHGIDIPTSYPDGSAMPPFGGSLAQELVPLVREGDLFAQATVDGHDDYCDAVYNMGQRVCRPRQ